ncbi:hypothetical protein WAI453_004432 [Rhynchosporium graminicola]
MMAASGFNRELEKLIGDIEDHDSYPTSILEKQESRVAIPSLKVVRRTDSRGLGVALRYDSVPEVLYSVGSDFKHDKLCI